MDEIVQALNMILQTIQSEMGPGLYKARRP